MVLLFLHLLLLLLVGASPAVAVNEEGLHLLDFKSTLSDPSSALSDWTPLDPTPCNWTGIHCSTTTGSIISISLPNLNLAGPFHGSLCRLPSLAHLDLSNNNINGTLPSASLLPCPSLSHLDLSFNLLVGQLPSSLPSLPDLLHLDLNGNNFTGDIPTSFGRFPKIRVLGLVGNLLSGTIPPFLGNISSLRELNLSYNPFAPGRLPAEICNLTALETLWLSGCNLVGEIPATIGNLRNLKNLDLSTNNLEGAIPRSITNLSSAFQVELYDNHFSGELPPGMSNLVSLKNIDASTNRFVGTIPPEVFELPLLESFHVYENQLSGEVPATVGKARNLKELRLFQNNLSGVIPPDLGKNQSLVFVDLSQNGFTGEIPAGICDMGALEFLMLIENKLSGKIPEGLGRCEKLHRLRLSTNLLSGEVPAGVWSLPHVYLIDLAENFLSGGVEATIGGAKNLSNLVIFDNRLSGTIPEELGLLSNLQVISAGNNRFVGKLPAVLGRLSELGKLDLQNNSLSGEIPPEIGLLTRLTELNLADNGFTGSIPPELGGLSVLNYLDLSNNRLTGKIPTQLESLTLNVFNFSYNELSGKIPPLLAMESYKNRFVGNPGLCGSIEGLCPDGGKDEKSHRTNLVVGLIFAAAGFVFLVGIISFYLKYRSTEKRKKAAAKAKWTLTSFHKLGFDEAEIIGNLDEDNVIGTGASGKVYKTTLSNGSVVAVKKLWGATKIETVGEDRDRRNETFETEVATLGKLRHRCIVKLWCCCSDRESKLLVYEYMPNGSLGDLLHGSKSGMLDWPARYTIALDAAEGLSYLHHDCVPPIVHRDIKSNNILLDAHFRAKVADFGVAKPLVVTAKQPDSMSVIAGSCGYIAPEYAYTLRVNEKSDVYSFGVVILELVTGRRPTEIEFGESSLAKWVSTTMDAKGVEHVVDPKLEAGVDFAGRKDEICKVLDIGLQCASSLPISRPSMRRVVKMLLEVAANGRSGTENKGSGKLSPYYYEDATSDHGSAV